MEQRQPGFNWGALSMGSKGALVAGVLMLIDLFLPWNRVCVGGEEIFGTAFPETCASASGWSGIGVIAGLLVIALLVWEGLYAAGALANVAAPKKLITAALAAGAALFALLRWLLNLEAASYGAYIGIILALALLYVAWINWQEHQAMTPGGMMPPPMPPPA
ncbi:MAG TPA: hypothetical protein VGZ50_06705 [Actinomycetota bacterium]|jgi:hypothetical protein|nr:hypothetical protein [Actinomycetota bacterium]